MSQLLLHLWGDYILQSDWMAQNKGKDSLAAFVHALMYSAAFWLLRPPLFAWLAILVTHFFIDRFRLARYVVFAKNHIGPKVYVSTETGKPRRFVLWKHAQATGYSDTAPAWLNVWLLIVADNTLHLTINYFALKTL